MVGLCLITLVGRAVLHKTLISVLVGRAAPWNFNLCLLMGGAVFPSLLVWPEAVQYYSGCFVGKWWPPGGFMPTSTSQSYCPVYLSPQWATATPCLYQETLQYSQVGLAHSLMWSLSFPLIDVPETVRVPLQEWSFCFLQSCGSPAIKSHWMSKPDSLRGLLFPLTDTPPQPAGKPDVGI